MKQRSLLSTLVITVLMLIVSGLVRFPVLAEPPATTIALVEATPDPVTAMFVSRQAPVVASLLVHPDRLDELPQVASQGEQPAPIRAAVQAFKQDLLAGTGLTYERDLRSWIGDEITLAITSIDLDRDLKNGAQPGYLTVVAVRNSQFAREALTRFWKTRSSAGFPPVSESYQGVTLTYGKLTASLPSVFAPATALVGNQFVLFANSPQVLKQAINNVQAPEMALAEAGFYGRALKSLSEERVGVVFVNLPRLSRWLGRPLETPLNLTDTGLAIGVDLRPQGLRLETALLTEPKFAAQSSPELAQPVQALQYLPSTSLFTVSGKDFPNLLTRFLEIVPDRGLFADLDRQLVKNLQQQWGTDLPWKLTDLFHGEYAFGILAPTDPNHLDWVLVAPQSPETDQAIQELDQLGQQQGFQPGAVMVGDRAVSAWTRISTASETSSGELTTQLQGLYTQVDNDVIFANSAAGMETALQASQHSLLTQQGFLTGVKSFSHPALGYFYGNLSQARAVLAQQFPVLKLVEWVGGSWLDRLESITASGDEPQEGIAKAQIFVNLRG